MPLQSILLSYFDENWRPFRLSKRPARAKFSLQNSQKWVDGSLCKPKKWCWSVVVGGCRSWLCPSDPIEATLSFPSIGIFRQVNPPIQALVCWGALIGWGFPWFQSVQFTKMEESRSKTRAGVSPPFVWSSDQTSCRQQQQQKIKRPKRSEADRQANL